jgi:hypothetical protein
MTQRSKAATKGNEPRISRIKNSQAGIPIPNREAVRPLDASARRPYLNSPQETAMRPVFCAGQNNPRPNPALPL